jgi:serine/threonine-protein kinase
VIRESRNRHTSPWKLAWAAAACVASGLLVWLYLKPSGSAPAPVRRFSITDSAESGSGLAISVDGSQVAYVTGQGIVVRKLDELQGRVVVTTNNVQGNPFFSPDGRWLGFKGWDALRKAPVTGGEVTTLVDRVFPVGAWSEGDIFYGDTRGLYRVPAAGGKPELLLATRTEQVASVEVLRGRHAVLYTLIPKRGNVPGMAASLPSARIEALDLRTGKVFDVLRGGGRPRVTSTGHLLYVSGGTLYAIGFDSTQLRTRGTAVPVAVAEGLLDYDISTDGTLLYQNVPALPEREMVWVDRMGREQSLSAPPRLYVYPRIAPDGSRIAVEINEGGAGRDTWIWDLRRQTLQLFTKDPAQHPLVAWSPDGSRLAFGSEITGVSNVYTQAADGSGQPERAVSSDALQMPISYAPDGRLLVSVGVPGQQRDIYLMQMQGKHELAPLIQSPANELTAEVSPDGRWLVYESDESGQFEIYVRPFPNPYAGSRWQVSSGGGTQPFWARDGREIFYRDSSDAMLAVPVTQGAAFSAGRPHKLFDGGWYLGNGGRGGGRMYDVSADGSRFLMIKSGPSARAPELVVVLNWLDELRRLAPLQ